jgi:hypothetical protein
MCNAVPLQTRAGQEPVQCFLGHLHLPSDTTSLTAVLEAHSVQPHQTTQHVVRTRMLHLNSMPMQVRNKADINKFALVQRTVQCHIVASDACIEHPGVNSVAPRHATSNTAHCSSNRTSDPEHMRMQSPATLQTRIRASTPAKSHIQLTVVAWPV